MGRLTDDDKQFGPITYGKSSWNAFRVVLSSNGGEGDDDHDSHESHVKASLTVWMFGWVFRVYLGQIIKRVTYRVKAAWDPNTIARMGRDWYDYSFAKDYGFSIHEGFLQIFYGFQNEHNHHTHVDKDGFLTYKNSEINDPERGFVPLINKSWSKHLPWTQFRTTAFRLYDDKNELHYEIKNEKGLKGMDYFDHLRQAKDQCPPVVFLLKDYDGKEIRAKTVIEESIYKRGEGWFKWLSWITPNRVYRRLDIEFDQETGKDKGSWKGGTIGLSTDASDGKTHYQAIKEFCDRDHRSKNGSYKMKFVSREVPV